MARPIKHDGGLFKRDGSNFWWMHYRDRDGQRRRESTNTADWQEAQKQLRERLQARDNNTLALIRKGEELTVAQWVDFFLENFSKPPIRTEKTHLCYGRVGNHLKTAVDHRRFRNERRDGLFGRCPHRFGPRDAGGHSVAHWV
jgi:hypothetical protein